MGSGAPVTRHSRQSKSKRSQRASESRLWKPCQRSFSGMAELLHVHEKKIYACKQSPKVEIPNRQRGQGWVSRVCCTGAHFSNLSFSVLNSEHSASI